MSWILSLNKFILVPVITEWSKCDDILMLDSALYNHTDREYYQSLMSEYSEKYLKVILDGLTVDLSPRLCDWLTVRFPVLLPAVSLKPLTLNVQERNMNVYRDLDQTTRDKVMTLLALIWYSGSKSVNIMSIQDKGSQLMNEILDCCPSLTKLEITIIKWYIDMELQRRLASAWKQLTVLVMVIWETEDFLILVKLVCTHCTVLQELNMMLTNYLSSRLTIPGCQFNCHNLEKLTLPCTLADEMLVGMVSQSRKVRMFNFGREIYPTIANIALVVPYLYNLEEFDIVNLTQQTFNGILRNCPNLKVLHVPSNIKLPSDGSVFLPSLTKLTTNGARGLDRVWLICPNLKELFTRNVDQALAMRLVEHLPRLKVLICYRLIDWRSEKCIRTSKLKIN